MVNDGYGTPKDMSNMPKPGEHGNRKTATIITTTGGGTFYSADCPYCGKSMPVGRDLSIMFSCCNNCNKSFDLRYPDGEPTDAMKKWVEEDRERQKREQLDKPDDDSSRPFNPPPAKPKFPSAPYGSPYPLRGPENWPEHYGGRHD